MDKGMYLWLCRELPPGLPRHAVNAHAGVTSNCPTEYWKIKIENRDGLPTGEEKMAECRSEC